MNQFNGFNGCTIAYQLVIDVMQRLYFPVALISSWDIQKVQCTQIRSQWTSCAPERLFSFEIFNFPQDARIHHMHQIFLGTGKALSKMWLQSLRKVNFPEFHRALKCFVIPTEVLTKHKSMAQLKFWKAGDFKLLFLHLISLAMEILNSATAEKEKILCAGFHHTLAMARKSYRKRNSSCLQLDWDLLSKTQNNVR